jgi:hypothetical protein
MANNVFINKITEVTDNGSNSPETTVYNIEAQRMSQGTVGSSKKPVYFLNGIPQPCDDDIGGGGDSIIIKPNQDIAKLSRNKKTVIATYKISDEETQELCVERVSSGYQKQVLFSGSLGITTGNGNGSALRLPFTNFEYLYIYIEDNLGVVGSKVIIIPTNILKDRLINDSAFVSCDLYGTLGIVLKFTSETGVRVEYVNNLPNYDSISPDEEGFITVICTKIEGVTLGISSSSWGQNTKDTLWSGNISTADDTMKYNFNEDDPETHELKKLKNYDTIFVYGHILNEDEEHVDIGAVDFLSPKISDDKALLTCGSLPNITKTLKFNNDGFYVIRENNVDTLKYVITEIDGIKYGVESSQTVPIDAIIENNMSPITSNAVYQGISQITPVTPIDAVIKNNMSPVTSNAVYQVMDGLRLVKITKDEYEAPTTKDSNALYIIGEWT